MKTLLIVLTVIVFVVLILFIALCLMHRAARDENMMPSGKRRFFLPSTR